MATSWSVCVACARARAQTSMISAGSRVGGLATLSVATAAAVAATATISRKTSLTGPRSLARQMHTSRLRPAKVAPYTIIGPPPSPPRPLKDKLHEEVSKPAADPADQRDQRSAKAAVSTEEDGVPHGGTSHRDGLVDRVVDAIKKKSGGKTQRFWKDVEVVKKDAGYEIHLSGRPLRRALPTNSSNPTPLPPLLIPLHKHHLATALALEWDSLTTNAQATKPHRLPLTSLVNRALDIADEDVYGVKDVPHDDGQRTQESSVTNGQTTTHGIALRPGIVDMLMRYLDTDSLLCWAPPSDDVNTPSSPPPSSDPTHEEKPSTLNARQKLISDGITTYLTTHVWPGTTLLPVLSENSIFPSRQEDLTRDVVRGWMMGLPAWELAGLERATLAAKGVCVAARLVVEWSAEIGRAEAETKMQSQSPAAGSRARPRFTADEAARAASVEVDWQTERWGEVEDTHDVDKADLRRQFGSVVLLVS